MLITNSMRENFYSKGIGLLETILAVALIGLLITFVIGAVVYAQDSASSQEKYRRALFFAEEGLEAARSIRDNDFSRLEVGSHGLATSSDSWVFSGTEETIGEYTRQIEISSVSDNIKKISSNVTWIKGQGSFSVSLASYLANWR